MLYDQQHSTIIKLPSCSSQVNGKEILVCKGEIFHAPENALFLLQSGAIHLEAIFEDPNPAQSQMIGTLLPGDPVGILTKYISNVQFCYRAIEDCVLQTLTTNLLRDTEGNFLVSQIFSALSQAALRLILSHTAVDISRGYPSIRALIYRYMEMKRGGGLKVEKLMSFVLSHTSLPEAQVAAVLASLTERAYLDIRRGKLNAINFPLPLEYQEEEMSTLSYPQSVNPAFRMVC